MLGISELTRMSMLCVCCCWEVVGLGDVTTTAAAAADGTLLCMPDDDGGSSAAAVGDSSNGPGVTLAAENGPWLWRVWSSLSRCSRAFRTYSENSSSSSSSGVLSRRACEVRSAGSSAASSMPFLGLAAIAPVAAGAARPASSVSESESRVMTCEEALNGAPPTRACDLVLYPEADVLVYCGEVLNAAGVMERSGASERMARRVGDSGMESLIWSTSASLFLVDDADVESRERFEGGGVTRSLLDSTVSTTSSQRRASHPPPRVNCRPLPAVLPLLGCHDAGFMRRWCRG